MGESISVVFADCELALDTLPYAGPFWGYPRISVDVVSAGAVVVMGESISVVFADCGLALDTLPYAGPFLGNPRISVDLESAGAVVVAGDSVPVVFADSDAALGIVVKVELDERLTGIGIVVRVELDERLTGIGIVVRVELDERLTGMGIVVKVGRSFSVTMVCKDCVEVVLIPELRVAGSGTVTNVGIEVELIEAVVGSRRVTVVVFDGNDDAGS
jgi:hypothetical protein